MRSPHSCQIPSLWYFLWVGPTAAEAAGGHVETYTGCLFVFSDRSVSMQLSTCPTQPRVSIIFNGINVTATGEITLPGQMQAEQHARAEQFGSVAHPLLLLCLFLFFSPFLRSFSGVFLCDPTNLPCRNIQCSRWKEAGSSRRISGVRVETEHRGTPPLRL